MRIYTGHVTQSIKGIHFESVQRFKISLWYKGGKGEVWIDYYDKYDKNTLEYDFPASTDWQQFQVEFSALVEVGEFEELSIIGRDYNNDVYIDDVVFVRVQ